MKLEENTFTHIRQWAYEKGIYERGDSKTQYVKLQEEAGELAKALLKKDDDEVIDAIGDCVVVLVNLAELYSGERIKECEFCNGDKGYYEDVAGDGGSKMWMDCDECCSFNIEDCINSAYEVIAKRTGKMKNGTFIKDK